MASGEFSQDIGSESINEFHPEFESGQSKDFHPGFVPVLPRVFQDLPDTSTPGRRPDGTATQRSDSLNSTRNNQPILEPRYLI